MSIDALKTQAGYCDPDYAVCCQACDHCVQLKRNYKCVRYGFIVAKNAVCREGFVARPADSMVQKLYGGPSGSGQKGGSYGLQEGMREEVVRQEDGEEVREEVREVIA